VRNLDSFSSETCREVASLQVDDTTRTAVCGGNGEQRWPLAAGNERRHLERTGSVVGCDQPRNVHG
jgi:hypothetical protein